jgi:hypothetical protein
MRFILFAIGALSTLAGCNPTTIQFENQVPGVTVHDMRFVNSTGEHRTTGRLLPGQQSEEVHLYGADQGETGRIVFELDLDGRRVHLEVEDAYTPGDGTDNHFTLTADTKVRAPLLAEAPMALWAEE